MPGIVKNMVKRFQTGRDWHIFRKIKKKDLYSCRDKVRGVNKDKSYLF